MKYCDRCHSTYPTEYATCPKDQSVLRPAAELAEGMVLHGKYQVVEKIGAGGMAVVYRVRHLHLQEDVAIKVVNSWVAAEPEFLERFRTEAVVTRKLRHANAVRVDDFDTTEDGRPFIVMEYVRGMSLRDLLKKQGWLPPSLAADIARQVALALGAAHDLGIVHRDIKPENILLVAQADGSDLVKVLDFGIAKITKASLDAGEGHTPTQTGIVLGTPQYVSPEQARGKRGLAQVDGRADLYSLGVVLYEMLTGSLPFLADAPFDMLLHHLQTPPTPPHLANPAIDISPAMSEVVMKALEKDPGRRFQSGAEMAAALSNPEIAVSSRPSAHVFSTEALAAAAAAGGENPVCDAAVAHSRVGVATVPLVPVPTRTDGPRTGHPDAKPVVTNQPVNPVVPAVVPDQRGRARRKKKWLVAAALGFAAVAVISWLGISFYRSNPVPGASVVVTSPPMLEKPRMAKPRRAAAARPSPPAKPAARPESETLQHLRAQELIATGYRRMQQKDFDAAREAFNEALEIEPRNPAAEKGLRAAETAQGVQGIVGVFKN